METNDTKNVSNVKGVLGGYGFSAPIGTDVVTGGDPFATLGSAFDNMGFISEDGIEEEIDTDTEEVSDMNGDIVFIAKSKEKETIVLTLISITRASLNEMHGHANVSETSDYILVEHTSKEHDQREYVFDLVLKDGRRWRKVVPNGQVTEVGSIVHGAGEVMGREVTITCSPDADGVRVYDYIQKEADEASDTSVTETVETGTETNGDTNGETNGETEGETNGETEGSGTVGQ